MKARPGSPSQASTSVHAAAVHDGVGPPRRDRAEHGVAVGDVELGVGGAEDLVAGDRRRRHDVVTELAAGAGDEQPHQSALTARAGVLGLGGRLLRPPPRLVRPVPADRRRQPLAEVGVPRPPAELGAQLRRVDGVAQVVARAVVDVVVVVGRAAQLGRGSSRRPAGCCARRRRRRGTSRRARPAVRIDEHGGAVVVGVDPVADVLPGAVQLRPATVEHVRDLSRDELLDVLVRPVVVRAVADRGPHAEAADPRPHQQVGAGLGGRVRARRVVRRGLGERAPGRRASRSPYTSSVEMWW